jgi:hypothetical protein
MRFGCARPGDPPRSDGRGFQGISKVSARNLCGEPVTETGNLSYPPISAGRD